jgi:cytochrome c-type biogenesis protein CcmH/NrfG
MILTLLIFKKFNGNAGKKKTVYAIFLFSIFLPVITIYLQNSNYWVGDNVLNKVYNNLNIREVNKIDPEAISKLVNKLEEQLIDNPNQLELIKKLAQLKYFLLDFEGALKEFEKGRILNDDDIDFLIGEANTRLVLEKESISKKTVKLFTKVLAERPNDITALFVLADHYFYSKNYIISKNYYQKLLSLIDKNSLEYKDIKNRLDEIENFK